MKFLKNSQKFVKDYDIISLNTKIFSSKLIK